MTSQDLLSEMKRNDLNERACLVRPPHRVEGALCLTHESDGRWLVSLVERGEDVVMSYFEEEHAACRYFLKHAISDPTYFKDFSMEKYAELKSRSSELLKHYGFTS